MLSLPSLDFQPFQVYLLISCSPARRQVAVAGPTRSVRAKADFSSSKINGRIQNVRPQRPRRREANGRSDGGDSGGDQGVWSVDSAGKPIRIPFAANTDFLCCCAGSLRVQCSCYLRHRSARVKFIHEPARSKSERVFGNTPSKGCRVVRDGWHAPRFLHPQTWKDCPV